MGGFIIIFIVSFIIFLIILHYYEKEVRKMKREEEKYFQDELYRWSQNKEHYRESLKKGNRHDVLKYGRMCGYDEQRITNDLLCYLNNIK
jgi:hypothetical protein